MLSLLRVRSYMSGGFDAGGDWSLQFDQHDGIKFYAVVSGECWLSVDGVPDPVRVKSGDCFLLPRGRAFPMASDMSLTPLDAVIFLSTAQNGRINLYNGGGQILQRDALAHATRRGQASESWGVRRVNIAAAGTSVRIATSSSQP
jgi:hypothetical protein